MTRTAALPTWKDPEYRRTGIGASDAAAAIGASEWRSPFELWLKKTGQAPAEDPGEQSEASYFGSRLERVVIEEYAKRNEVWVLGRGADNIPRLWQPDGTSTYAMHPAAGALFGPLRHPHREFMFMHVDALALADVDTGLPVLFEGFHLLRGLEVKTAGYWVGRKFGEHGTDEVPPDHLVQGLHQMAIARALWGDTPWTIAALTSGQRYSEHPLPLEPDVLLQLEEAEAEFWQHVVSGTPPELVGTYGERDALTAWLPARNDRVVNAPTGTALHVAAVALKLADAEYDRATKQRLVAENHYRALMADAGKVRLPGGASVVHRQQRASKKVDWEAAFQQLAEQYSVPGEVCIQAQRDNTVIVPGKRPLRRYLDKLPEGEDG